ncbi:MAG: hypothetical protein Q8P30_02925 [Candidatus Uhrbacteria bacterium]|nr:hypothetical protein [Candidatus Uhrbacteria bacterium]
MPRRKTESANKKLGERLIATAIDYLALTIGTQVVRMKLIESRQELVIGIVFSYKVNVENDILDALRCLIECKYAIERKSVPKICFEISSV